jgi:hypothetical protein
MGAAERFDVYISLYEKKGFFDTKEQHITMPHHIRNAQLIDLKNKKARTNQICEFMFT